MSRIIKFRAWNRAKKKMLEYTGDIHFWAGYMSDSEGAEESLDLDFLQFTGLLDKNRKEIYEGDIIAYEDTESEYVDVEVGMMKVAETPLNSFAQVKFHNGYFGLDIQEGELFKYHKGIHSFEWWEEQVGEEPSLEVIGNIYENEELLKKLEWK